MHILKDCGQDLENHIENDLNFFYKEVEGFNGKRKSGANGHDDMVDALSDGYAALATKRTLPSILGGLQAGSITTKSTLPSFS